MKLICLSVSHETCPLEERSVFSLKPHDNARICKKFLDSGASEALSISTCNRVEIYCVTAREFELNVLQIFSSFFNRPIQAIKSFCYIYQDHQALEHLFNLACGARSLVIGETEILGQLKMAYASAVAENTTGKILNRSFQRSFSLAKQIRSGTEIGRYRVSVASVAVDEALNALDANITPAITIWGTGAVGRAACQAFAAKGYSDGIILTRDPDNQPPLPGNWKYDNSDSYRNFLNNSDIFISCTGAPHPVIHPQDINSDHTKLILIDLAVPRDTSLTLKNIANILLIDLEDLAKIINLNKSNRQQATAEIAPLLSSEAQKFWRCLNASSHEKCLIDWRLDAHELLEKEMESLSGEWPDMPPEVKEKLHGIANKLMHRMLHWPSQSIQQAIREGLPCADFLIDQNKIQGQQHSDQDQRHSDF